MLVQAGLCQTCSETTLLVFPRGGSFLSCVSDLHGCRGGVELCPVSVDNFTEPGRTAYAQV